MSDEQIEAFADLIHDAAIQYANGRETDFRPVARQIAEASRRAALEEAAVACEDVAKTRRVVEMAVGAKLCVDAIRALAKETNNG